MGQVSEHGDSPMDLFTQVGLSTGNSEIPIGAYRVYIIPDKKSWTLVINKNVAAAASRTSNRTWYGFPCRSDT